MSHILIGGPRSPKISGRTHRWENGRYVRRKLHGVRRRQLNEYETRLFQNGRKRLAILSGAGAIGISVHADLEARNQQRWVFYAFQLSWSADQQMQAFGRVHRSHQASAPVIRLVLLDLGGQKRLVNAVSKRLAALGALSSLLKLVVHEGVDLTCPLGGGVAYRAEAQACRSATQRCSRSDHPAEFRAPHAESTAVVGRWGLPRALAAAPSSLRKPEKCPRSAYARGPGAVQCPCTAG